MRAKKFGLVILILVDIAIIFICLNFIHARYRSFIAKERTTPEIIPPDLSKLHPPRERRNILFQYISSKVKSVEIIGDFNDWMPQALTREGNVWKIVIQLEPGEYAYNFVVDGKIITDPNNLRPPRDTGRGFLSSVVVVKPLERPASER